MTALDALRAYLDLTEHREDGLVVGTATIASREGREAETANLTLRDLRAVEDEAKAEGRAEAFQAFDGRYDGNALVERCGSPLQVTPTSYRHCVFKPGHGVLITDQGMPADHGIPKLDLWWTEDVSRVFGGQGDRR